jgi:hypothetical protein
LKSGFKFFVESLTTDLKTKGFMDRRLLLGCFLSLGLYADQAPPVQENPPPPEVVEKQLEDAEREFKIAKEMFNPWYAGPLLTPSAHILPPGNVNIQPYLFWTNNYGKFSESGKSHKIPNIHTLNPQLPGIIGVLPWMHLTFNAQYVWNKQRGEIGKNWGDTSVGLSFGLLHEGPYNPALLLAVKESFPSGSYQRLDPDKGGIDATGAGSFETTFSFNISKIVWWVSLHPMNFRLSLNYTIPALVKVHGFNAYGGGFGTDGKVRPGSFFQGDFGYEYSFTQRWVAALDIVYTYSLRTKFSGHSGVDATGAPAVVGGPFNDQLSLAPALEYNPNPNMSFLGGVWFTAWGRNSLNFVSGVISYEYTF